MHYVLHVIIPDFISTTEIPNVIENMLKPFDYDCNIQQHETDCFCVNRAAFLESRKEVEKECGKTFKELEEEYFANKDTQTVPYRQYIRPYFVLVKEKMEKHPLYQKPDPDCGTCHGSGKVMVEANPNGKYDWYVIGGRWSGWLTGKKSDDPYEDNIDDNVVSVQLAKEKALKEERIPAAVLTPDGTWYDGYSYEELPFLDKNWKCKYLEILGQYPDFKLVVVDCHE
jgi:hypothetical protein